MRRENCYFLYFFHFGNNIPIVVLLVGYVFLSYGKNNTWLSRMVSLSYGKNHTWLSRMVSFCAENALMCKLKKYPCEHKQSPRM